MKKTPQGPLRTDLPWIASRGLKSTADGLEAKSIEDTMESIGTCDPDEIGCDINEPASPLGSIDDNPKAVFGKNQRDD